MMAYERILVALDLPDEGAEVLAAARQQAENSEMPELHLVNVVKPLHHTHGTLLMGSVTASENLDKELHDYAAEILSQWAQETGVPAERVHVLTGNPAFEIRRLADELQADLIVIGSHGRHGLGLLLGSTANGVLHGARCDVLTVRVH